jgi:hypothetical protein
MNPPTAHCVARGRNGATDVRAKASSRPSENQQKLSSVF